MTFVDINFVHFYQPSPNFGQPSPPKPSESIELPMSAYEHEGIDMINLTNLPVGARKLEMSNKNLRESTNVPKENDEFPSIEELLAVIKKTDCRRSGSS